MSVFTIPGGLWTPTFPTSSSGGAPSYTNLTIDAAAESVGMKFTAGKTGNINKIHWKTNTTTTGASIAVGIRTVDGTNGFPTTTAVGTDGTQTVLASDDNVILTTTLGAVAAVTKGTTYFVRIAQPTSSFGSMQVGIYAREAMRDPYVVLNTGVSPAVSWAVQTGNPTFMLEYDDGTFEVPAGCFFGNPVNTYTYNNTSTPDTRGAGFQVPNECTMDRVAFYADMDGDANISLVSSAYNQGAGTGILATFAYDLNNRSATTAGLHIVTFSSKVTLSPGTTYRLIVEPTTATSCILYDYGLPSSGAYGAKHGLPNFYSTSAKDPTGSGSWTNYNNGTNGYRVPFFYLNINDIVGWPGNFGFQPLEGGLVA